MLQPFINFQNASVVAEEMFGLSTSSSQNSKCVNNVYNIAYALLDGIELQNEQEAKWDPKNDSERVNSAERAMRHQTYKKRERRK